jgi:hypothetical protein
LEAALIGSFATASLVLLYATVSLQKMIPRETAAAASTSK